MQLKSCKTLNMISLIVLFFLIVLKFFSGRRKFKMIGYIYKIKQYLTVCKKIMNRIDKIICNQ